MPRQKAIEEKCRECIYDELDEGTWRMQVAQSRSKVSTLADSVAVQPHYEPMLVQVGVTP